MVFFLSIRLFERDRLALHSDTEYYMLLKVPRVRDVSQVKRDRSGWPDVRKVATPHHPLVPGQVSTGSGICFRLSEKKKERIYATLHFRDAYLMSMYI